MSTVEPDIYLQAFLALKCRRANRQTRVALGTRVPSSQVAVCRHIGQGTALVSSIELPSF